MKNYNVNKMNKKKSNLSEDQIKERLRERNTTKLRHNQRGLKVFYRKNEDTEL